MEEQKNEEAPTEPPQEGGMKLHTLRFDECRIQPGPTVESTESFIDYYSLRTQPQVVFRVSVGGDGSGHEEKESPSSFLSSETKLEALEGMSEIQQGDTLLVCPRGTNQRLVDTVRRNKLCNPRLRDPLSVAIGFMRNPGRFRACCRFTVVCWDQALNWEMDLPTPYVTLTRGAQKFAVGVPVLLEADVYLSTKEMDSGVTVASYNMRRIKGLRYLDQPRPVNEAKQVIIKDLPNLETVGDGWIANCCLLQKVEFSNLPRLRSVGSQWLFKSSTLSEVVISDLPDLKTVGDQWLADSRLVNVTIENLPSLRSIGGSCLANNLTLRNARFQNLPSLTAVGHGRGGWLSQCPALRFALFENLPALTTIGKDWLRGCYPRIVTIKGLSSLKTVVDCEWPMSATRICFDDIDMIWKNNLPYKGIIAIGGLTPRARDQIVTPEMQKRLDVFIVK